MSPPSSAENANLTPRSVHLDKGAVAKARDGVASAHDAGHAELACGNRAVAQRRTHLGDHGARHAEHGNPRGVEKRRDEYLAGAERARVGDLPGDTGHTPREPRT